MNSIDIMYKVIEQMAVLKLPAVFKGAMVLQHIIKINGIGNMSRSTTDIDMNYINVHKKDIEILNEIKNAVDKLDIRGVEVTQTRKSGIGKSAGFTVNKLGEKLFTIDVSIEDNPFYTEYISNSGVSFYGASKEKIYTDKIVVISDKKIFRRVKDIYDMYTLSYLDGFEIKNIINILNYMNKEIGNFNDFINSLHEIREAYTKFTGIQNKPQFETIYGRVRDFCMPFIVGSYKEHKGYWDKEIGMWIETF